MHRRSSERPTTASKGRTRPIWEGMHPLTVSRRSMRRRRWRHRGVDGPSVDALQSVPRAHPFDGTRTAHARWRWYRLPPGGRGTERTTGRTGDTGGHGDGERDRDRDGGRGEWGSMSRSISQGLSHRVPRLLRLRLRLRLSFPSGGGSRGALVPGFTFPSTK